MILPFQRCLIFLRAPLKELEATKADMTNSSEQKGVIRVTVYPAFLYLKQEMET